MNDTYFSRLRHEIHDHGYSQISKGQLMALTAYEDNELTRSRTFEVAELPNKINIPDFVKALREAGVRRILITDGGDGLFESLLSLADCGCRVLGIETRQRGDEEYAPGEFVRGIKVDISDADWTLAG